jgi:hypothetical protein
MASLTPQDVTLHEWDDLPGELRQEKGFLNREENTETIKVFFIK